MDAQQTQAAAPSKRVDQVTRSILLTGLGMSALSALVPLALRNGTRAFYLGVLVLGLIHALALGLYALKRAWFTRAFLLVGLWLFFFSTQFFFNQPYRLSVSGYVAVIIIASQLLGQRGAVITFGFSLAASVIAYLHHVFIMSAGVISEFDISLSWLVEIFYLIWIGSLLRIASAHQQALSERTRKDESALAQANRTLIQTQTELEAYARDLERRVVQLQVASEIAQESAKLNELDLLLERAVNLVRDRFGFYHCGIYLIDDLREYAVLKAATGEVGQALVTRGHRLRVGAEGIVGFVTATGKHRVAEDVQLDELHYKNPLLLHTRSELTLPLIAGQQIIGAFDVQSMVMEGFDEDDINILQTMANQLAVAIDNARLLDSARRQLDELIALHNVANVASETETEDQLLERTTSLIADALFPINFGFLLMDENSQQLVYHPSYYETQPFEREPIPIGMGIIGKAAEQGRTWVVCDVNHEPAYRKVDPATQSELAVPIIINKKVVGVINTENREIDGYDEADIRLVETIARQLATALQKIRAFEALRRRVAELAALREASLQLNSSLDLLKVLEAVLQSAQTLVGASSSQIFLYDGDQLQFGLALTGGSQGQPVPQSDPDLLTLSVLQTKEVIAIPDGRGHPFFAGQHPEGAAVGLPIIHSGEVWGVMSVHYERARHAFDENELRVLSLLSGQAASALVNARLYTAAQSRAEVLAEALTQREQLVRMRNEFVQNVSHELRTPLAIIRGYAELLESSELGELNKQQWDAVNILNRRVQMLNRLVDDLVTIMEAETLESRREDISLTDLAQRALADFVPAAHKKQLYLVSEITPENLVVRGTASHLTRVYDNLLGNAIKFSPPEGTIKLCLRRHPKLASTALLEVVDEGIGIPPEKLERIFERFYQVDGTTKRRFGGTGLGLALVKEIVEAHGGRVSARSEVGKGSTFTVTLPLAPDLPSS